MNLHTICCKPGELWRQWKISEALSGLSCGTGNRSSGCKISYGWNIFPCRFFFLKSLQVVFPAPLRGTGIFEVLLTLRILFLPENLGALGEVWILLGPLFLSSPHYWFCSLSFVVVTRHARFWVEQVQNGNFWLNRVIMDHWQIAWN